MVGRWCRAPNAVRQMPKTVTSRTRAAPHSARPLRPFAATPSGRHVPANPGTPVTRCTIPFLRMRHRATRTVPVLAAQVRNARWAHVTLPDSAGGAVPHHRMSSRITESSSSSPPTPACDPATPGPPPAGGQLQPICEPLCRCATSVYTTRWLVVRSDRASSIARRAVWRHRGAASLVLSARR